MKKYYIVVGFNGDSQRTEMLFGDYDKNVAYDEREELVYGDGGDGYSRIRVLTLENDTQDAIDARLAELNWRT